MSKTSNHKGKVKWGIRQKEPTCKRCGKCCTTYDGEGYPRSCRWLIIYKDGKTSCAIYHHRINAFVGYTKDNEPDYCEKRENRNYNIPDCPYNK